MLAPKSELNFFTEFDTQINQIRVLPPYKLGWYPIEETKTKNAESFKDFYRQNQKFFLIMAVFGILPITRDGEGMI